MSISQLASKPVEKKSEFRSKPEPPLSSSPKAVLERCLS
jgi:hypothetical protein